MARRLLRLMGKPETLLSYVKDRPGTIAAMRSNVEKSKPNSGGHRRSHLRMVCVAQLIGIRQTKNGWPECTAASIVPIMRNTTRIGSPR